MTIFVVCSGVSMLSQAFRAKLGWSVVDERISGQSETTALITQFEGEDLKIIIRKMVLSRGPTCVTSRTSCIRFTHDRSGEVSYNGAHKMRESVWKPHGRATRE